MSEFPLVWRVRSRLPERYRQRCRILKRSRRMNSALVEFSDGYRVVTSRNYVRRAPESGIDHLPLVAAGEP
jgi:hypothetical protein